MTFLAPLFLLGALAGAVPVLLHLIHRRTTKELPFGTLRFLRVSVQKTRRRKRIHDLLLLLLRVAVLVLVAVGLARPTVSSLQALWGESGSAVAIILDNSASMGMVDQDVVRFETARRAALEIVDQLADGDQVALFLTGGPPLAEQGRLDRTHEKVRQALSECRTSYERADLTTALERARQTLAECDAAQKQIFLVSDLQEVAWSEHHKQDTQPAAGHPSPPAPLPVSGARGDEEAVLEIPVIVVDCQRAPKPNTAIQSVKLDAPVPVAGVPLKATVELLGAASTAQQRHVDLYVDGAKRASSPVLEVGPGERVTHDFLFTVDSGGLHRGEARLVGEDGSTLDDQRFFTLQIDRGIPVAIVKPRRHEIAYLEETYYLERALAPGRSGSSAIAATVLLADQLASEPLSPYKIVFCVNLPAVGPEAARRLADYVAGGGNLVWVAGEAVDPGAYNAMNESAGGRLLPAPLGEVRSPLPDGPRDSWHVGWLEKAHPALAALVEPASLYESVLVYKYIAAKDAASSSGVRVLARLDDGQPVLLERGVERGRVFFLATSAYVDWTNLPLRPIFLPLLTRLVFNLAGGGENLQEVLAGSPIVLAWEKTSPPESVEIRPPSGETIRRKTADKGSQSAPMFRWNDTHDVGVYVFRPLGATADKPVAWAVNVDPVEADPAKLDREDLKRRLAPAPVVFAEDPDDLSSTFAQLRRGESLWEVFLAAVLVGLVAESYWANRLASASPP